MVWLGAARRTSMSRGTTALRRATVLGSTSPGLARDYAVDWRQGDAREGAQAGGDFAAGYHGEFLGR